MELDILIGRQWFKDQSFFRRPSPTEDLTCTVHNGNFYIVSKSSYMRGVAGGMCCRLSSLLDSCTRLETSGDATRDPEEVEGDQLWREFRTRERFCNILSFKGHLLTFNQVSPTSPMAQHKTGGYTAPVYAFSPSTRTWSHVGDAPPGLIPTTCALLPGGEELVLVGVCFLYSRERLNIYKASIKCK